MNFKDRKRKIFSFEAKARWKKSHKPILTITGDWLTQAGFNIGETVDIKVLKNKLIIVPQRNGNTK